ncbi:hypothetical protein Taro_016602 [Colocasia esculenta]|uniref:Uncharacterized protein n=1 Tax=Colocasia esculenta TaxID=4460 RepID=A0A843UL40_COLES|nr:hypothetical protein [Colocasia esculenta]
MPTNCTTPVCVIVVVVVGCLAARSYCFCLFLLLVSSPTYGQWAAAPPPSPAAVLPAIPTPLPPRLADGVDATRPCSKQQEVAR